MVESSVCISIASIAEAVIRPRYGTRTVSDMPGSVGLLPRLMRAGSRLDHWAGAFRQRTECLVGGRGADQFVEIPLALAFGGLFYLEQIDRMDLAPVLADLAGAETVVAGRHRLHARARGPPSGLRRVRPHVLHCLQVVQRAGIIPRLRHVLPQRDLRLD